MDRQTRPFLVRITMLPEPIIFGDDGTFSRAAADAMAQVIRAALATKQRCIVGLSGGTTPRAAYALLGAAEGIDWFRVWLFLADERMAPPGDPKTNAQLVQGTLLAHATVPSSQCIFPDTGLAPAACADEYDRVLRDLLREGCDVLTLGMGDDGHTASLFPPVPPEASGARFAIATTVPAASGAPVRERISITFAAMEQAAHLLVLVSGGTKRDAWAAMTQDAGNVGRWPLLRALGTGRATVLAQW